MAKKLDFLTLAKEARAKKKKNNNVINATLGMLNNENSSLFYFPTVHETLKELCDDKKQMTYAQTEGTDEFCKAVFKWVLGKYEDDFLKHNVKVIPTLGGTGALYMAFKNTYKKCDILLPDIKWEEYLDIVKESGKKSLDYQMFDNDGSLNTKSILKTINNSKQDKVILVINDPCHNPTGYSMSDNDYTNLVNVINECNKEITLVLDVAYADLYSNQEALKNRYHQLLNIKNLNLEIIFSGSKTLGVYGLRVGALIHISDSNIDKIYKKNFLTAGSTYVCIPHLGLSLVERVSDSESFKSELNEARELIRKRSEAFIKKADEVGLKYYPFKNGFYISIPTNDSMKLFKVLKQNNIYVIPQSSSIRVALCSISIEEANKLPQLIKERMI